MTDFVWLVDAWDDEEDRYVSFVFHDKETAKRVHAHGAKVMPHLLWESSKLYFQDEAQAKYNIDELAKEKQNETS
jgi:hypothetical protein